MEFIQIKSISELKTGDVIRHKTSQKSYLVTDCFGSRATAVRTVDITNPGEWEVMKDPEVITGEIGEGTVILRNEKNIINEVYEEPEIIINNAKPYVGDGRQH
jgi:hypothetical protein